MGDGAVTVIEQQAVVLAKHAALLQALITSNELHELQLKVLRAEVSSLREQQRVTVGMVAESYQRRHLRIALRRRMAHVILWASSLVRRGAQSSQAAYRIHRFGIGLAERVAAVPTITGR